MLAAPTVRVAAAGLFLVTASLFAVIVFVPVLLQVSAGLHAHERRAAARDDDDRHDGRDHDRRPPVARTGRLRRLPVLGASVMATALAGLAFAAPASSPALVVAGLVVFGAGFGLTSQLLVVAVQNGVERTRIGVATSTTAFFRAFGGAAGAAGLGAVFTAAGRPVADAVQTTFFAAAAIAAIAAIVMAALPADVDRDTAAS